MPLLFRFAFLLITSCCSATVLASNAKTYDHYIELSKSLNLAEHPVWHRLMIYEYKNHDKTQYQSAIINPGFFLAKDGATNSKAELEATVTAFFNPLETNPDQHPQCVFRGRFVWLMRELKFSMDDLNIIDCPEYNRWTLNNSVESLSIIFATGYLGNPASFYGHTLLKMNSSEKHNHTKLEDVSVNFGAIVPDNEGPIRYIFKGLFGGYDSGFSHIKFYFHNHNYGESEHRNMWEYELNLDKEDVDLVTAHAWEVLKREYTYYFLTKNCAYRMAELFDVVQDLDIKPKNYFWAIPQTLIQEISETQYQEKPLINDINFIPSRQTRLYQRFQQLDHNEKAILKNIITDYNFINSAKFSQLDINIKYRIIDTLLDYYQFIRNDEDLEKDPNNKLYRQTLAKRYQLPPSKNETYFDAKNPPHLGRRPSLLGVSSIYNKSRGNGLGIKIRPTYYDVLDTDNGHIENSALTMGELDLQVFHDTDKFEIKNLTVVEILSVNNSATGLPGDLPTSWKLKAGFENLFLSCESCLAAKFQGDYGYSFKMHDDILLASYIGGAINENKDDSGWGFYRFGLNIHSNLNNNTKFIASSEYRHYFDGFQVDDFINRFEIRHKLSNTYDIRFRYEKNIAEEAAISVNMYW